MEQVYGTVSCVNFLLKVVIQKKNLQTIMNSHIVAEQPFREDL